MRNSSLVPCAAALIAGLALIAQEAATEAPAGFTTPPLTQSPAPQTVSNGLAEPPGDTFVTDQMQFERVHDPTNGLGPIFNAASCAQCHQNNVTGSASQITELRVGHKDANGNFANPTVLINEGTTSISGRSIVNDRAICDQAQEHVPDTETIRTRRAVLNTLGDGFVEAVDDQTLVAISANQPARSGGRIHGEFIEVPVLESPGATRIGRFGWKDQQPTVLSFAADAYLNEMGVTNRLRPRDVTSVCKVTTDPEDTPDSNGLDDIDHFAQFIRATQAPPRDAVLAATPAAQAGGKVFDSIGCNLCHVETILTAPAGTVINGGSYTVTAALGNKYIHPYGDFLLHDVGTGDGILQAGPADTVNKLRTAPLWGLHIKSRFMHDLDSLTLEDAIRRHKGEAGHVTERFRNLSANQQQQLLTFLKSL
ncbi:MAG TPA: di-heme oxidoredictase family protein [Bryobacteraceae bacterium]|nr:di-heme oxidoredictase family protein [Bryobacteraceae bacterium]